MVANVYHLSEGLGQPDVRKLFIREENEIYFPDGVEVHLMEHPEVHIFDIWNALGRFLLTSPRYLTYRFKPFQHLSCRWRPAWIPRLVPRIGMWNC